MVNGPKIHNPKTTESHLKGACQLLREPEIEMKCNKTISNTYPSLRWAGVLGYHNSSK